MSSFDSGFRAWPKKEYELWEKKSRRRKREESDPEKKFGRRRRWSFFRRFRVAFWVLMVVAAGLWVLWLAKPRDVQAEAPTLVVRPDFSAAALKEKWVGPAPRLVAEAFLKAKTIDERIKWVRTPDQVRDLLEAWYAPPERSNPDLTTLMALEVTDGDSRLNLDREVEHAQFVVEALPDDWRFLSIVKTPSGGKVDVPAFIRQCSASWSDILSGAVPQADVRVFVAADNYHNFDYSDETRWLNYTLSTPDCEEALHLYLPADSALAGEMPLSMLEPPRRMFLRIRATTPENLARRQFELVEILAPGWTL